MNSIITLAGRRKMAEARAGIISLPKIVGIAIGDGGTDADGNVKEPGSSLVNELIRREADSVTKISDTCYRYMISLKQGEFAGAEISEMALYDAEGDIVAIKNFRKKIKDEDMEMDFEIDDSF